MKRERRETTLLSDLEESDAGSSAKGYPKVQPVSHPAHPIGQPVTFVDGFFEDRTVRAELEEIQKADLGRKYALKDRRPLDPPPVVQVRLFEVFNVGTPDEHEEEFDHGEYSDVMSLGMICHADLFPVYDPNKAGVRKNRRKDSSSLQIKQEEDSDSMDLSAIPPLPTTSQDTSPYDGFQFTFMVHLPSSPQELGQDMMTSPTPTHSDLHSAGEGPSTSYGRGTTSDRMDEPEEDPSSSRGRRRTVIGYFRDHPIEEESKCTSALVGARYCEPTLMEYGGKNSLFFVFSDLSVRLEGEFVLRYRFFNVCCHARGSYQMPVLAECFGGSFRIYSTKEFPGLRPSTTLTKASNNVFIL
ncbi:hypothetical protein K474DRAFT_1620043 [Panus rudis PR-1116 ss-1]|nr:hypothetical protein K474DRAFT_1620043 [Panus rudis PR-1116 ss-1]